MVSPIFQSQTIINLCTDGIRFSGGRREEKERRDCTIFQKKSEPECKLKKNKNLSSIVVPLFQLSAVVCVCVFVSLAPFDYHAIKYSSNLIGINNGDNSIYA